jgi:hypothetical protein
MYSGGCLGAESLNSASGIAAQEAFGSDVLSASKFLRDQSDDANQDLSVFQEIELQSCYRDDNVYLNQKQHNQTPNGFLLLEQTSSERKPTAMIVHPNSDTEDTVGN